MKSSQGGIVETNGRLRVPSDHRSATIDQREELTFVRARDHAQSGVNGVLQPARYSCRRSGSTVRSRGYSR